MLWVTRKEGRIKAVDYREAPHLKHLVQGSEQHQRGAEEGGEHPAAQNGANQAGVLTTNNRFCLFL